MKTLSIDVDKVRRVFRYDTLTGDLFWRTPGPGRRLGIAIRAPNKEGYFRVVFEGKLYAVHRIIFAIIHGWCPPEVDHQNRNNQDNKEDNLLASTHSKNKLNASIYRNSTTGITGVSCQNDKWIAYINIDSKRFYLGSFSSKEEAVKARQTAYLKQRSPT